MENHYFKIKGGIRIFQRVVFPLKMLTGIDLQKYSDKVGILGIEDVFCDIWSVLHCSFGI